jgi:hypothetical protein
MQSKQFEELVDVFETGPGLADRDANHVVIVELGVAEERVAAGVDRFEHRLGSLVAVSMANADQGDG